MKKALMPQPVVLKALADSVSLPIRPGKKMWRFDPKSWLTGIASVVILGVVVGKSYRPHFYSLTQITRFSAEIGAELMSVRSAVATGIALLLV
jgi:hypothetical protein